MNTVRHVKTRLFFNKKCSLIFCTLVEFFSVQFKTGRSALQNYLKFVHKIFVNTSNSRRFLILKKKFWL